MAEDYALINKTKEISLEDKTQPEQLIAGLKDIKFVNEESNLAKIKCWLRIRKMTKAEQLEEERKQKSYNLYENIIEIVGTKGEK